MEHLIILFSIAILLYIVYNVYILIRFESKSISHSYIELLESKGPNEIFIMLMFLFGLVLVLIGNHFNINDIKGAGNYLPYLSYSGGCLALVGAGSLFNKSPITKIIHYVGATLSFIFMYINIWIIFHLPVVVISTLVAVILFMIWKIKSRTFLFWLENILSVIFIITTEIILLMLYFG